jgi:phosphatidylinositol alpha-1,6-mannosyltransferase
LKQKILLVSSEFPPGPGGIAHHAWFLAKQLSKNPDIELHVIAPDDYTSEAERKSFDSEQLFGVFRFVRKGKLTYLLRVMKLMRLLKQHEYTHFLSSGKFALWMVWIQKLFLPNAQTLCILHGSEVNLNNILLRKFTHQSISKFQTIVSVSKFTQTLMPNWILNRHKGLVVIPNGLDISDMALSVKVNLQGRPALLTVGHVSPRKGQHRMIQALPAVLKKFPQVIYHIVGRPLDQEKLTQQATALGVADKVIFHGAVGVHGQLWDYYLAADIFILLSENQPNGDVEGFGIVALEANALGTPVIGAKYCGVEEAVKNGKSGVLVDGNNIEEIIQAIDNCTNNQESLAVSSQVWAKAHDWEIIGKRFLELI